MNHGGKRTGSGRPKGTGKFKEATKAIRIPISDIDSVLNCIQNKFYRLPLYQTSISAGYPSPADDDLEDTLDLNEMLIKHPTSTFFLRVSGNSMVNAGIYPNDILIVDRSIQPSDGKIIIASVNGELTVKRLVMKKNVIQLVAENKAYSPIVITEEMDFRVWGVVINVIHYL